MAAPALSCSNAMRAARAAAAGGPRALVARPAIAAVRATASRRRAALGVRCQAAATAEAAVTTREVQQLGTDEAPPQLGVVNEFAAPQFDTLCAAAGTETLVVVDVYTTWCGPCKMMAPELEKMAQEYPGVLFAKLDCTSSNLNKKWAMEHKVKALPTFLLFKDGKRVNDMTGSKAKALRGLIEAHQ